MGSDATCKHILSHAIMVEELLRWLVAERHGMQALVDALNFSTLTRMHEQSVSDGDAEGRLMGQRESIQKQAAMKFDAETAARLGAVLEDVTDQEAFDVVLAALIECDTPSDLLARATEARRHTNGRNAPGDC